MECSGIVHESPRRAPPRWLAAPSVAFGILLIVAAHEIGAWLITLNMMRASAELMAASMAANDAAYRAGRERRPRIDPLNPATWSAPAPAAELSEQDRARTAQAMRQVAIVDVGVSRVWRPAGYVIGGVVVLFGLASLRADKRRAGLFIAICALGIFFTVVTLVGLHVIVAYGGFQPRPPRDYLIVSAAGCVYPCALWAFVRRRRRHGRIAASPLGGLPDQPPPL